MTIPTIQIVTAKERLEKGDMVTPEPIVSGLLFRKSMAVLGAPEDSFKTHWALQLTICLAGGIPCYSHSLKKSVVVYMCLEGGEGYILERLEEKIAIMGVNRDEILSKIHISDCSGMRLDDRATAEGLEVAITTMKPPPEVVIFDPITYAMNEDVRFSPQKAKLCRNLLSIANSINGVTLPIIHCRKDTQNNDSMDDFLGSSIIAAAAATRIKLFRLGNRLNVYAKTRYAERPDEVSLVWKHPLLEVLPEVLKPRENAKRLVLKALRSAPTKETILGNLVDSVAAEANCNPKTVRSAVGNLEVEGEVTVSRLPKSAKKLVELVSKEKIQAS
ncbi:AAA family ATPase [Chloroflexota bacterium]